MSTVITETFESDEILPEALTLVDLLRLRASRQPEQLAYTFLLDGDEEEVNITYSELDRQARSVAASLQPLVSPGDRVLLLYPPGLEYIAAFFGCLYAGAVAVPAYPPRRNRNLLRLQSLVADAQATVALTTGAVLTRMAPLFSENPYLSPLRWLTSDSLASGAENKWEEPILTGTDLAFLQYTSGSTSLPKGVMLTHGNLLHNERVIQSAFGQTEDSIILGWLPLYHDMGLIGNVIQPLFVGARCVLMSPASFLQRPFRWLQAISRYRATTSGGPNFAYDLCARKVTPEQRATLDLSSWQVAFNGSEPIRHETIENFAETFASCGFRREAFYPCYGLAEATLIVSGRLSGGEPVVRSFDACALENNHVVETDAAVAGAKTLVGSGVTLLDQEIVVVRPQTAEKCEPCEVGEIWVSSPSVARGYWNKPEQTEQIFNAHVAPTGQGPYLRTGDLGFFSDGELFVTGRLKDLIIIRGLNHYPQDIELTAERAHDALRPGCGAAFSVELEGEERLVVVQEADHHRHAEAEAVCEAIVEAVAEAHEVQVYAVVLIRPGTIAKTSSGKIQRHACRAAFLESSLDVIGQLQSGIPTRGVVMPAERPSTPGGRSAEFVAEWLRSLLAAQLGVEASKIDVNQSVARYGVDSLAAIELAHAVEESLGIILPVTTFLQSPSIAEIAAGVSEQLEASGQERQAAPILSHKITGEHPLSHGQKALWFLHEMAPESAAYNIAGAVRILSALDTAALRRAFQTLVNRHAALRTTFHVVDGKPVQRVHDDWVINFEEEDDSLRDAATLPARLAENAERPFDLRREPALRVSLFRRSDDEHVLLLAIHHILADFWSLAVLTHELGALYEGEIEGTPPKLAPLSLQYTDVVRWQEEALQSAEGEQHWTYWQQQLATEPAVLNLPTDRPRPPVQTYCGASHSFELGAELTGELKALSHEHGTTLYMTLLAAFQTLLSRYTQQTDIAVGSPTANRRWAAAAGLVGYFVNPVVLRGDLSGDPTFEVLLGRTRQTVLDAFKHQDFPFPLLVERLHPAREASRSPLFQVQFILQKGHVRGEEALSVFATGAAGARMNLGVLTLESLPLEQRVAQFDLTLTLAESEGRLAASLQYNTDLFDASTVERMAGHFNTLLHSAASQPSRRVSELTLLTTRERDQLLHEWSGTSAAPIARECIHELFEAQAKKTPERIAVTFEDVNLTYGDLNARANRLARHLREHGVRPEVPVAVCVERGIEMLVALLGVLKAGGAYVPLDPAYPKDRIAYILEETRPPILLTQHSLAGAHTHDGARVLCIDTDWPEIERHSGAAFDGGAENGNLAYVIYTSGSTGRPKGVQIAHRSATNFFDAMKRRPGLNERDVVLALTTLSFDISVLEIFLTLAVGARVVVVNRADAADGEALSKIIGESGATLVQATPATWRMLLDAGWQGGAKLKLLCGGEALPVELANELVARSASLWNVYGPTEATVWASTHHVEPDPALLPLGDPIANTTFYVLDANLQPVPIGVAGELHIGGIGLARGYYGRPDLSAEKFIPDPFDARPGARFYKTGDLVRRLSDGRLEYLGRADNQVKVRGFRIELGEIEAVLRHHPAVAEAVVLAKDDARGQKRLGAYVLGNDLSPSAADLRAHLKETLPDYMVPSAYVVLSEFPITPSGKIDRIALLKIDDAGGGSDRAYVAPRTVTEELLAGVWAEVLSVERVGINDNFFELGGHSLLATQVVSRIRENFSIELALRELFEYPTIAALAMRIDAGAQSEFGMGAPEVRAVARDGRPLPLSFGQQRLWFFNQLEPLSSLYNISGGVRLTGALHIGALEQTLSEIVRRHEVLRTTFAVVEGEPVQVINEARTVNLPVRDLGGMEEAAREAEALRLAREEAALPFDLERGPLMRATLLRLAADEHILLVTMHHIVSDGWSVGVLINEIGALYESFVNGEAAPLAELQVQYADYAVWQREWLRGETLDNQLSYWKQQLAGASQVLELPTDRPRPAAQSNAGAQEKFSLSEGLSERLKALSRREGVTLYMTLLAAFQTLLSRYTSQEDILVGADIANRHRGETEGLIGFFVNLLVMRGDLSGDPTFSELLRRTREVALGAYAHQDLPFEKLVEELSAGRDISRAPLFQVLFVLQNAPAGELQLPGLKLTLFEPGSATSKFDLLLSMEEKGQGIEATLEYSTDLFDAATIRRMAANLETLLEGIVESPESRLSTLPVLTVTERHKLLVSWNDTATDYPRGKCIHTLYEEQAELTPDSIALVCDGETVTYGELNSRANQLANFLRTYGVGPEVLVGLCVERSVELIVGLLGILKAGGAYLPLDAGYPLERLTYMLEDAQVPVLLTQEHLLDSLPAHWGQVVCLDSEWELIEGFGDENPRAEVSPENLAYVMYTSGSTGRAKGVSVPHRAVVRLVKETNYAVFGPEEVFLQLAPISFDASTFEVWGSLLNGARLVLMPPQSPSLEDIGAALAGHGVTTLWLTAGLFHLMTDERPQDLSQLRQLLAGGDVLSPAHVGKFLSACADDGRLINGYGPTEGTTFTCCYAMTRESVIGQSVPLGTPIANTQVYVLDNLLQLIPTGVVGDLYIGGEGLSRGYLNRPELTAEKFVPHPYSSEPGARLYKSGDLARFLPDGRVEFLGRLDNQIKLRGFRIELGEIEAALMQHGSLRKSLVVVHADESGDKRLAAYVVAADSDELPAPADLRRFLSGRLPDYMIPSFFVVMDEFPLTTNGKIDRHALPAPDVEQRLEALVPAAPPTYVEELLADIWCEVLGLARVGVAEDFFELGGHSLLATQIVSRVRERFDVELALREVFEHPTVAGLAAKIEAGMQSKSGIGAPEVRAVARDGRPLPLSFGQQRLWFFNELEPLSSLYNISGGVRLTGALHVEALEQTLSEIVRRHEVLRTTFAVVEGEPVQVVEPARAFELSVRDLSHLSCVEWAHAERGAVREESERAFDLGQAPLLRATLLRFSESEHVLLVTMHHIVSDGWSLGVLIKEVAALYAAFVSGEESPLAELEIQYADYAVWQREWLSGEVLDNQLSYWKRQLEGAPAALELPTDRQRPPVQSYCGAQEKLRLSEELSARLRELCRREGVTLYMTLLAAWQTLLSRYSGQTDFVVGTPIANRQRGETEDLIGFFVNLLALRADLSGDPTFSELLARVREACFGAYAHQELPFDKLVEELDVKRDMSRSPLFQVLFVLQNAPMPPVELAGLLMTPLEGDAAMSHFDLTLDVSEEEAGLLCTLEYNSDLFDAATAGRIINQFQILLDGAVVNSDRRISALPLLSEADEYRQLFEWNETAVAYPSGLCLHQLFEAQAARTPHAPALVFEDERLSYAELNRRADTVARHLAASGVGAETLVGVLMERSAEAVLSLLGVLKAGAAYLPIDPTYPSERIAFMLADARVSVLLTQRRLLAGLPAQDARVIPIESCTSDADVADSVSRPVCDVTPDNLAYVIYTSGSTGKPKGVMITHRAVVNHNFAVADLYDLRPEDKVLQFASLSFDVAVEEIFPTWLRGGSVVMRSDRALDSHRAFLDLLERESITVVNLSTPYWNELMTELTRTRSTITPSLRLAAIGGEKGLPEHFALSQQLMASGARLLNVYGPTETTVTNTAHDFDAERCASASVPIGRPLGNTRLYVLDGRLRTVPAGVPAELFIGGHSLARGYLARPELTAERFLPDPYSHEPGARMYRSGDVTRYLSTSEVEFVGRVDEQVKVRGFRVELGEIETALVQHPQVQQALVIAHEEATGGKRLCAYIVCSPEAQTTGAELRAYLKERLPDYMVPSFFVLLDEFPLTANSKIDRRRLPEPSESAAPAGEYVAPRTETERRICELLGHVLNIERVSLTDDFFELGGHSLLATQVMSRVRDSFGVELPLRTLFEHPTAETLAQQVQQSIITAQGVHAPPVEPASRDAALPLSFAQQRLWFLHQLEPGGSAYNVPAAVWLRGALDVAALVHTLSEIIRRHEVLRTTFSVIDGQPVPVINGAHKVSLPVVDLCGLDEFAREAEAHRLAQEEAERPFDLEGGPLLRAGLLKLSEQEHVCLLTMHHIVSDGWSMTVLINEVAALYNAFAAGLPSPLPELPVQYADYAVWQRRWLQGETLDNQLAYWRRQLGGTLPVVELPSDRPRSADRRWRGATHRASLPAEVAAAVRALSREQGATLYMTLLAAFQLLVGRYTGLEDVPVGTAIANRQRGETEGLIGFFVNTLVMRGDLSGNPTFTELVRRAREVALGAYGHQEVPFERVVEELRPGRTSGVTPLFQVAFGVQNAPEGELRVGGLEVSEMGGVTRGGRFDLTVWVEEERGGGLSSVWTYDTDLFDEERVERMAGHFGRLVEGCVAEPERRAAEIPMLSDVELAEQLDKKKKRLASNDKRLKASRRQAVPLTVSPAE